MKTNSYESTVLINAALDDEQIESVIIKISDLITNSGSELQSIERWGRKRLAYVVKKSKVGYYAIFRFVAPTSFISKLERMYTLDESVLRHLTIVLDKFALEHFEKNKSAILLEAEAAQALAEKPEVIEAAVEVIGTDLK